MELLQRHCLLGQVHYRAWQRLNDSFRDQPEAGNLAPTFFIFAAEAHLNSALLILNRFVDKRRDSLSIKQFLDTVDSAANRFPKATPVKVREACEEDRKRLAAVESIVERVRSHRNEQFLHLSKSLMAPPFGVVPAEQEFQYSDIYTLLRLIGDILNTYGVFLTGSELLMEITDEREDHEYLLQPLTMCAADIEREAAGVPKP